MTAERWQRITELFEGALECEPQRRVALLEEACAGDPELRTHVEVLLASDEAATDFLHNPAFKLTALDFEQEPADSLVGQRIGPYQVQQKIGHGGMGAVYLAVRADEEYEKKVAIKLVKRGMDSDAILGRFRNERQILANLDHPNIAKLLDGGTSPEGLPYFVMDYVDGLPIDVYCDNHRLPIAERLKLFGTVCSAVHYAHQNHVLHRDLKPTNILVTDDGVPKLLDFGIAKLFNPGLDSQAPEATATVLPFLTPHYASPEQLRGEKLTPASDVYALGVLLYQLLTGHRPYRLNGGTPAEMARVISEQEPEKPSSVISRVEETPPGSAEVRLTPESVSERREGHPEKLRRRLAGDLDNIVLKALRREPERRYGSVDELSEDILRHLEGRPVLARKDTLGYRSAKFIKRNKAGVMAAALLAVILLFLAVVSAVVWVRLQGPKEPKPRVLIPSPLTTYLGQENQPVLSPDGRAVAFCWVGEQQNNFDIYRKIIGTDSLLRLTSNPAQDTSPAWSPDGRFIAFHRNTGKDCGFYVIPSLGGPERKVAPSFPTRAHFRGRTVDWMPDGRSVVVVDRDSEYLPLHISAISIESGEHRLLMSPRPPGTGVMGIAVSPNGREVAFVATNPGTIDTAMRNSDLYVVSSSGGEPRRLTYDEGWIRGIAWLVDGTELLFASNRTNDPSFTTTSPLWRIGASGGVPEPIPVDFVLGYEAANPHVSKHGNLFVYERRERWITNIWKGPGPAASDRGPAARLIESTWPDDSPQFSPDGQRIAFTSARSGVPEIWVCDANGSNSQQLTSLDRGASHSRWLPNGGSVSFDSPQNGSHDIYVVNSDGGQPRRLTSESSDDRLPRASSNGQWLYFASNRTGRWEVWKVPVQGGSSVQVTNNGGFEAFESSDGNTLYFTKHRGLYWTFGKSSLWKLPLGDSAGGETLLLPEIDMGYWAVLPTGICYLDSTGDELPFPIRFFDFATQRNRKFGEIFNEPMWNNSSFSVSSDGQSILFTRRPSEERDLMIVENLGKTADD